MHHQAQTTGSLPEAGELRGELPQHGFAKIRITEWEQIRAHPEQGDSVFFTEGEAAAETLGVVTIELTQSRPLGFQIQLVQPGPGQGAKANLFSNGLADQAQLRCHPRMMTA